MTITRPPRATQAGQPGTGQRRGRGGLRIQGLRIRFTTGAHVLAALAVLASAFLLPGVVPGEPVLAYLAATAVITAGLLASLTVHELAHALVARRYGGVAGRQGAGWAGLTGEEDAIAPDGQVGRGVAPGRPGPEPGVIRVGFFGGASHGGEDFSTARALGRVAAAGPAASFAAAVAAAVAGAGLALLGAGPLAVLTAGVLVWVNALLAVVNALPGTGLDGGRVVQAIAWRRGRDRARSAVTAARVGQFTGVALIVAGVALIALGYLDGLWAVLLGVVMIGTSRARAREVLAVMAVAGLRVRDVLPLTAPATVPGWLTVQAFLDESFERVSGHAAGRGGTDGGRYPGSAGHPAAASDADGIRSAGGTGHPGSGATAFPVRDFGGRLTGLVTLAQLAAVPAGRRATLRISDVATPLEQVVTTRPEESLSRLMARLAIRPATPAALQTAGHALVLTTAGPAGSRDTGPGASTGTGTGAGSGGAAGPEAAGVLTPADFARASQLGALHRGGAGT